MKQHLISLYSIIRKELIRIFRIWIQTLVPPVITLTLYFIIFGSFIGSQLKNIGDYSYMSFIAPGLIMMSVITNSYANTVSSFFSAKFQRNIEELLVSPTPNWVIVLGYVCGGMARGISVGFLVSLVSLIFVRLPIHNLPVAVLFVFLTSFVFSLAGMINGIFAKKFDDISIVPTFVITPLTYLGGVFYSISLLPHFWQTVSRANPIVYMINGFRYGFLGTSDINVWVGLTMLIFFSVALFSANLILLKKGVGTRS
ncbi:ABC transporter permease [Desulforhopalus singaporensis]|uniref:Transport permease protein n=1 Tax=Desulforhopalus singaporensis TaxID=91360 RepID=A0A1H0QB92_9BACT|nr:ABC transporter permease [Desulforhopalus singaporensis]SDP14604.1 ABC-2 type transport system permease protein [Desulforhopalus singaporensis]